MTAPSYLGIDVSKATLDLGSTDRYFGRFDNTPAGRRKIVKKIAELSPTLVAIEATGGYERRLTEALFDAGLPVAVVQPGCVRHYAKSLKLYAKTDRIDAKLIARFAEAAKPRRTEPIDEKTRRLRALRDRRSQVVEDRVREENRLEACDDKLISTELRKSIKRLRQLEAKLDNQIAAHIKADAQLRQRSKAMQTLQGVGIKTATTILAYMPEIGRVNRQRIAALVGVAPYAQESGKWKGRGKIYGGRAPARAALYMAALTAATRCKKGSMKDFYDRLVASGKQKKVALIAVARKLLVQLNSIIAKMIKNQPAGAAAA